MVGSLYASGYTADEIDSIAKATDFTEILYGKIPRKNKPFKEKELGREYVISVPFVNFKLETPIAFSYGQGIQNLMTELTKNVNHLNDFSKLPIPFLCIATNLKNGKKEVLKKGFLPEAVRASGAFPSLIAPVKIDGKLLMDGGLVDNFPVEEVIKMGADVVIGVDIQGALLKPEELTSAVKILGQIVGFQMYKNDAKKNKLVDILIRPKVKQYGVTDFDKIDIIIKEGEIASEKHFDELVKLAKRQLPRKKRKKPKPVTFIKVNDIKVVGNKTFTDKYIKGKLDLEKNDSISYKELSESINSLFSTKEFKNIQCKVRKEKGKSNLLFSVEENPIRTHINIAGNYNDLYKTGVLLGVSSKNLLFQSDFLSTDVVLGDNIRYNFDYFIDNGVNWSFGFHSHHNKFSRNTYVGNNKFVHKINVFYKEYTNQAYVQMKIKRKFSVKLGAEHNSLNLYTDTFYSDPNEKEYKKDKNYKLTLEKSSYLKGIGSIILDTYDNVNFPKEGMIFRTDASWFLQSSNKKNFNPFLQLYGKMGFADTPLSSKLSVNIELEGGVSFGNNQNDFLNYTLGGYGHFNIFGFVPLYGYDFFDENLITPIFAKTTATVRYEFLKNNYLKFSTNSALVGKININTYKDHLKNGYLLGYELAWNSEEKNGFWYFNLGYWF